MSPDKLKKEIQDGTFKPKEAIAALAAAKKPARDPEPREPRYVAVEVRLILTDKTLAALNEWCHYEHQQPETIIARRFTEGFWDHINEGRKKLGLPRAGPAAELGKLMSEVRAELTADGMTAAEADAEIAATLTEAAKKAVAERQSLKIKPLAGLPVSETDEMD